MIQFLGLIKNIHNNLYSYISLYQILTLEATTLVPWIVSVEPLRIYRTSPAIIVRLAYWTALAYATVNTSAEPAILWTRTNTAFATDVFAVHARSEEHTSELQS